jgi:heterodisulfide reductase subunit A
MSFTDILIDNFLPWRLCSSFDDRFTSQTFQRSTMMPDKPTGSVMVVGGGIAGMQASLDLADSGYYVYLVEKSPSVGGVMAQLDKTFPTNDCAM